MKTHLPILCSQEYGPEMRAVHCTQCSVGWDNDAGRCIVPMGCEHLPLEANAPDCPIQDQCQHQIQHGDLPCPVRARGLICESALLYAGWPDPAGHNLAFTANAVATDEDIVAGDGKTVGGTVGGLEWLLNLVEPYPGFDFGAVLTLAFELYGPPVGIGRHRAAFRDGDFVVKVPIRESGVPACEEELQTQGDIYARTELDPLSLRVAPIPVVRMEWVTHTGQGGATTPEDILWVRGIDSGQVGLTSDGRLVAYDWETF